MVRAKLTSAWEGGGFGGKTYKINFLSKWGHIHFTPCKIGLICIQVIQEVIDPISIAIVIEKHCQHTCLNMLKFPGQKPEKSTVPVGIPAADQRIKMAK